MNTPRSKKPTRFEVKPARLPDGNYAVGIGDENMASVIGYIITLWPHIEEEIIPLFEYIARIENIENARIIFRSIVSQHTRITIMKNILEKSPHSAHFSSEFDRIIQEYLSLSKIRNSYAHGKWYTNKETQKIYLEERLDTSGVIFVDARLIEDVEVRAAFDRMMELVSDLKQISLYRTNNQ